MECVDNKKVLSGNKIDAIVEVVRRNLSDGFELVSISRPFIYRCKKATCGLNLALRVRSNETRRGYSLFVHNTNGWAYDHYRRLISEVYFSQKYPDRAFGFIFICDKELPKIFSSYLKERGIDYAVYNGDSDGDVPMLLERLKMQASKIVVRGRRTARDAFLDEDEIYFILITYLFPFLRHNEYIYLYDLLLNKAVNLIRLTHVAEKLTETGHIHATKDGIRLTEKGIEEVAFLLGLHTYVIKRLTLNVYYDMIRKKNHTYAANNIIIRILSALKDRRFSVYLAGAELAFTQFYIDDGRFWFYRPDGGIVLRDNNGSYNYYLFEIDGYVLEGKRTNSRISTPESDEKIKRVVRYYNSRQWELRYEKFPNILIISESPARVYEVFRRSGNKFIPEGCPVNIFVTGTDHVLYDDPIGPIWLKLENETRIGSPFVL